MRRREFLGTLGGIVLAARSAADAQPSSRRISVLMQFREENPEVQGWVGAFREELAARGWREGENVLSTYRWGGIDEVALRRYATEIVASKPDLIIASSSLTTRLLRAETDSTPIIFTNIVDPVGQGLVSSLSRPAGNVTGFVNLEPSVAGKYVELLKEIAPRLARVVIFYNPVTAPYHEVYLKPFRAAAASLGLEAVTAPVRSIEELKGMCAEQSQIARTGLIAMPDGFVSGNHQEISALALRYKLPMIVTVLGAPKDGALLAYGNEIRENYRRAAEYADRILRGEKAGALPVQFPTRFQMIINLKTAKALGLEVPPFFQQRADQVIE